MSLKLANADFEQILIKQETVSGEAESPTISIPLKKSSIGVTVEQVKLQQIEGEIYGPTKQVAGKIKVEGSLEGYATPALVGLAFTSLFGNPQEMGVSTGILHGFSNQEDVPSYTVETTHDGQTVRSSGLKINKFDLKSDSDSTYSIVLDFIGQKSISSHRINSIVGNVLNFNEDVFFKTTDTLDVYTAGGELAVGNVEVTAVTSRSVTVASVTGIPTMGQPASVTKSRTVPASRLNEKPLQFLTNTSIKLNGTPLATKDLSLSGTNNVSSDEGFLSGSSHAQLVNGKKRLLTGSMTILQQDVVRVRGAYNLADPVMLELELRNIDGHKLVISGMATIDTVPSELSTNTNQTSTITFSFNGQFGEISLIDTNSDYKF